MCVIICDATVSEEIRALSCVILRRTLGTYVEDKKETLWEVVGAEAKQYLKTNLLQAIQAE